MRLPVLVVVSVLIGALAPAATAQTPPTVGGPADGASFTQGDPITFTAYDDTPTAHVYVHISKSPTPDSFGVIGWDVWFGELGGGPNWSTTWNGSSAWAPGTYYWQIYRTDDTPCWPDCYYEAGVRSFTLAAAPPPAADAPTLNSPSAGASFTAGSPIDFSASDPSAGANVSMHISTSGVTDSSGVIGTDVWATAMAGGPTFTAQWFQPPEQQPGTYYWQAYRHDCDADPDCKVESAVRAFTLQAPAAGPPVLQAPPDGATFRVGDPVGFAVLGQAGQSMWVRVSASPVTDAEGLLGYDMGIQSMNGGPDFSVQWSRAPIAGAGTYYWQAYRIDCSTPAYPDCYIESGTRSFRLVEGPPPPPSGPPTPVAPAAGAEFRAGKGPITFSARDDSPDADVRVLISRASRLDDDGMLRTPIARGDLRLSGWPVATTEWENSLVATGTLYWQPYRDECDVAETEGCRVGGAVREFVVKPSRARIAVPKRCYRERKRIPVAGRGFNRRKRVDLSFLAERKATVRTNRRGRFKTKVKVPNLPNTPGAERDRLWAEERNNPANEDSVRVKMVAIAMSVNQSVAIRQGQKIRFKFSGFPNKRVIFGHYLLGGRVRGMQVMGRTRAPCGTLRTRAELIPARIERPGRWTAQYDARRAYSKRTQPRLRRKISVTSVPARAAMR